MSKVYKIHGVRCRLVKQATWYCNRCDLQPTPECDVSFCCNIDGQGLKGYWKKVKGAPNLFDIEAQRGKQ